MKKRGKYAKIRYMNKDVIYIEPEDDITDIISRIKASKQKIIALVPPKKLGIMRSAVNIKLIAKTAKMKDKAVVIVTVDPSLVKLSALSGLPVAKTLNSRPMLPSEFTKRKKQETEELEEKELDMPAEDDSNAEEVIDDTPKKAKKDDIKLDSDDVEEEDDSKKNKKKKNKGIEKIPNFDKYRKWIIFGGIGGVLLIVIFIWAFIFAPYAKITVNMKTVASNISENITLVTDEKNKNNKEGKFLLEQIKYEEENSIDFEATGKANHGEKATGTVTVKVAFSRETNSGSVTIPAGSAVSISGKNYSTIEAVAASWEGPSTGGCDGGKDADYCYVLKKVPVQATGSGAAYNIEEAHSGTINVNGVAFYSSTAMTGGTDKNVKVVSENDIAEAQKQLTNANNGAKDKLFAQIGDGVVKIESSYKSETKDSVSTPKVAEEVKEGEKAKLTAKTVHTIYVVDKTAIEEYVKEYEKDKVGENDKLYSIGTPFFERFLEGTDGTFTAKFKTTVKIGPELSDSLVLDTAKGRKVGEVKALVKDISSNINDVVVETSFPWVRWVPNDANKIGINITVEE